MSNKHDHNSCQLMICQSTNWLIASDSCLWRTLGRNGRIVFLLEMLISGKNCSIYTFLKCSEESIRTSQLHYSTILDVLSYLPTLNHMHTFSCTHAYSQTHTHTLYAITCRCSRRHTHRSCLKRDDISPSLGLVACALRTPDANWKQEADVSTEVSKSCHSEYLSSKIQSSMLPWPQFPLPQRHHSQDWETPYYIQLFMCSVAWERASFTS